MRRVAYRDQKDALSIIMPCECGHYIARTVSSNAKKITQTTHDTFEDAYEALEKRCKGLRELGDI